MPPVQRIVTRSLQAARHPCGMWRAMKLELRQRGISALDLGLPWISFPAIDALEGFVRPEMVAYEYGSGGSTLWLAKRCARVVAIEERARWAQLVEARLVELGLRDKVDLRIRKADRRSPQAFSRSAYAQALPGEPADVILIDGCERLSHLDLRPVAFRLAEDRMGPGGMIVVDDAWRYPQLRSEARAKRVDAKIGFGPGRRDQSYTDLYRY